MSTSRFKCIDLFTGVAGIQYAVQGLLEPLLYCEIDKDVQAVLRQLMHTGQIPQAPIVDDVRDTTGILRCIPEGTHMDIIIATPSCKGFSCLNTKRPGLAHPETSLVTEVVRLVHQLQPEAVFMENVPGIVPDLHRIDMGNYTLVHHIFSAEAIGAPHMRRRWYGLWTRNGSNITERLYEALRNHEIPLPDWSIESEPQHICDMPSGQDYVIQSARIGMMGNSVVPLCAHDALCELVGCPRMREPPHPRRMVLDPTLAETERRPSAKVAAIPAPCVKERFPTPRWSQRRSCNRLIERSMSDLPTFLRFWSNVRGPRLGLMNPDFAEWLMGYPRGWTQTTRLLA